jgi:hypothetical protein
LAVRVLSGGLFDPAAMAEVEAAFDQLENACASPGADDG